MMKKGNLQAVLAYLLWGILPIYWKALQGVPAVEILSHRIIWSFMFLLALILVGKNWLEFRSSIISRRVVLVFLLTSLLLSVNWLTYIWGVNAGFIVETSLGYFINPLVSVLLGVFFLKEKLRTLQWIPIGLAAVGVLYLTIQYGSVPWIALVLAGSFGIYGLLKKLAPLGALYGLTLETGLMFVPSLIYLLFRGYQGAGALGSSGMTTSLLLVGAGIVTALPLLLFSSAVRQIRLSTLGVLQYISPTCQFLLGVLVYHEPLGQARLVGFLLIWIALIFFWIEGWAATRQPRLAQAGS